MSLRIAVMIGAALLLLAWFWLRTPDKGGR
jgi:HAMP domain-containing protein